MKAQQVSQGARVPANDLSDRLKRRSGLIWKGSAVRSILVGFETAARCWKEDAHRLRRISKDIPRQGTRSKKRRASLALMTKLRRGLSTLEPDATLASSQYMRSVRLEVVPALLEAVKPYADSDLRTVTVISRKWRFTAKQLRKVFAIDIKRQFRTQLQRAGILDEPGFLVAFVHGEYEPTTGLFQLHFHLLTTADKAAALLNGLKGLWGYEKTATGASAIKRSKVSDRPEQFSYLLKSYWPERPVVEIRGKPKRVRGVRRIKGPRHTDYLLWLDRTKLSDIMLLNQCTYRNGKFHLTDGCISRG